MQEFKVGKLKASNGMKVHSTKRAVAIALAKARRLN